MRRKQMTIGPVHRLAAGICCLVSCALAGCGDGRIARYPVTGKVMVDGKPAAGVMLIFCPTTGSEELMRERPTGYTIEDGTFKLTTFVAGDGAPAGDYKILARWATSAPAPQVEDPIAPPRSSPDRFRGKYFNLDRTTLTAKVEEGPTDLPPFELTTK